MLTLTSAKVVAAKADLFKGEARITFAVKIDGMTADNVRSLSSWAANNVPVTLTVEKLQFEFELSSSKK